MYAVIFIISIVVFSVYLA